jgi:hypothetical protein
MPIFTFLHVLAMFAGVAMAYGPAAMMVLASRNGDVPALRTVSTLSLKLGPAVGTAFILGLVFGVLAIFFHGFNPLQGWLVIAYILFAASLVMTFAFTNPWQIKVQAAAQESPDEQMSPELNALVNSPRNRALLIVDALLIVALIAVMVLKPLPGPLF